MTDFDSDGNAGECMQLSNEDERAHMPFLTTELLTDRHVSQPRL
jgi:hypothetical protein